MRRREDRAKGWRNERVAIGDGSEILLRSVQCRRCSHWHMWRTRRTHGSCELMYAKTHMFDRCPSFNPISYPVVIEMVMECLVADGVVTRMVQNGVVKLALTDRVKD